MATKIKKTTDQQRDSSVESTDLLAALTARMKHAEKRYLEEQQEGDAISIASTRGTFLALRDARDLVRHHFSANDKVRDESPDLTQPRKLMDNPKTQTDTEGATSRRSSSTALLGGIGCPNNVDVLMHYHCSPCPHERLHAPAVKDAVESLVAIGALEPRPDSGEGEYQTTEMGRAWVEAIGNVPPPRRVYVDERGRILSA